jgi:hypothetical protein
MDLELGGGWVCGPESPVSDDAEPDLSVFFNKHMSNVELANKLRDLADIVEDDLEFDVAGAAPHSLTRVSAPANIILITNVG